MMAFFTYIFYEKTGTTSLCYRNNNRTAPYAGAARATAPAGKRY